MPAVLLILFDRSGSLNTFTGSMRAAAASMKATRFGAVSLNGRENSGEQESSRGLLAGHTQQYADSKQSVGESMHNSPSRRINAQRKWLRLDSKGKASYITVRAFVPWLGRLEGLTRPCN